ncbi:MAG: kelch repeat-containing protein [Elusimicrobiaceae bacterium]|nr:kelch repeat-containing protein [Elusimicrobiaceae bacterium]
MKHIIPFHEILKKTALAAIISVIAVCAPDTALGAAFTARSGHSQTLLQNGNILIVGGRSGTGVYISAVQVYDMTTSTMTTAITSAIAQRSSHTVTLIPDGRAIIAGGENKATSIAIFDPVTNSLTETLPAGLPDGGRISHTATLLRDGRILITGGLNSSHQTEPITTGLLLTVTGDIITLEHTGQMITPRYGHTATLLKNGHVFVAGGRAVNVDGSSRYIETTELYDPDTNVWSPGPALIRHRAFHTATSLNDGYVLVAGGKDDTFKYDSFESVLGSQGYIDEAEKYDPLSNTIVPTASLPARVSSHTATLMASGVTQLLGGYGNFADQHVPGPFNVLESTVAFTPITGSTNTVRINLATSRLSLIMDANFSAGSEFSGTFSDAYVIFDSATVVAKDFELYTNPDYMTFESLSGYHSMSDISGKDIYGGRLRGEFPLTLHSGSAYFPDVVCQIVPNTISTATFTLTEEIGPGGEGLVVAGTTATIYGQVIIDPAEYIYSAAPQGQTKIITAYAWINTLVMTNQESLVVRYTTTSGEGFAVNLPVSVQPPTVLESPYANVPFLITLDIGSVYNESDSSAPVGDHGGFYAESGELTVQYSASPMSVRSLSYETAVATCAVKEFIFADTFDYSPSSGNWGLNYSAFADVTPEGKPVVNPIFNQAAMLTPASDNVTWGGQDCNRTGTTLAPTPSWFEEWADCDTIIANRRVHSIITHSQSWNNGPALSASRGQHTANILANGKILVAGGTDGTSTLASAEILDPALGSSSSWVSAGTMTYSRSNHTATMLPNGNILVTGGYTQGVTSGSITSAEIYYPSENAWVETSPLNTARQSHSAIMVPKGLYGGNILVIGGYSNSQYLDSMELYNPVTSQWTALATTLTTKRAQNSATLMHNGNILICGGVNGTQGTLNSCEVVVVHDDGTFTVQAAPALNQKRHSHTATLLRDGRVAIIGGNNGAGEIRWQNISDGGARSAPTTEVATLDGSGDIASWTMGADNLYSIYATGQEMIFGRQNHTATLLPNGKVLVLGGVTGLKQTVPYEELFNADFSTWTHIGNDLSRGYHTSVITSSGMVMAIGGYDGSKYIGTTQYRYFMPWPDAEDSNAAASPLNSLRQPSKITLDQSIVSRGASVTLQSGATNFAGISEGSGGGSGGQNSYHSHPRVYVYMMDNPSGWMLDLSTVVFSTSNANIGNWNLVRSSITFGMPILPYGWYQMRVANNSLFSDGVSTFVSKPRPGGEVNTVSYVGKTTNTVSWNWTWTLNEFSDTEGFEVRSTTNNVFFATVAYSAADTSVNYILRGLGPNTRVGVQIAPFNLTRSGTFVKSATYYTYANPPLDLTISSATFSTVSLSWAANSNSESTQYEVSMATNDEFSANVSTPVPFSTSLTTNTVTVPNLAAGTEYFFRVRARNGSAENTDFNCGGTVVCPSTVTITSPSSVQGVANGTTTIRWSWQTTDTASTYEVYSTPENELVGVVAQSTKTTPSYTMVGLSTNTAYSMKVRALNGTSIFSEFTQSPTVYTLTDIPAPYGNISQTMIASTDSITAYWLGQSNPSGTVYSALLSTSSTFGTALASVTVTQNAAQPYMSGIFSGLTPSTSYYVAVCAINGDNINSSYVLLSTAPKYTSPAAPTNFVPTNVTASGVTLSWNTNGNAAGTYYQLSYSTWPDNSSPATLVSFDDKFTAAEMTLSGLWTQTSYYFYLGAKNNSLITDSKNYSATVPMYPEYIVTQAGPLGTSTGAVAGFSGAGTITGTLPTGRNVTLTIPAASFASPSTEISIAEDATTNLCPSAGMPVITFKMLTSGGLQPQVPVVFDFNYTSSELSGVDRTKLVLARYNEKTHECMPLQTTVAPSGTRRVTATLNHFSYFQLMTVTAATDLENVFIYPNPFYPNRGNGFVTFSNLPTSTAVRIYTLSGEKVWDGSKNSAGPLVWEGKNSSGNKVASGVYLAVVEGAGQTKVFKVGVER